MFSFNTELNAAFTLATVFVYSMRPVVFFLSAFSHGCYLFDLKKVW